MKKINVLLLCGGGSEEHEVSLLSANYFQTTLAQVDEINLLRVELDGNGHYQTEQGETCVLTNQKTILFDDPQRSVWPVDYVIPCIHGYPGETGDIQSFFELIDLPYFGCQAEASRNCFNKITAKMWFSALNIPNTPYLFLSELSKTSIEQTKAALTQWGSIFIKAASQGSSVGCYRVDSVDEVENTLAQAFQFSSYIVVEKTIKARELEVAVYELDGEVIASKPGEVICSENSFYTFDEKYAADSQATTKVEAEISSEICEQIRAYSIAVFKGMKLRHLSRIDFFLTEDNEILLNEINTFPGMTPISMFPKMLSHNGDNFSHFLISNIKEGVTGL